jgi:hypothetical protein
MFDVTIESAGRVLRAGTKAQPMTLLDALLTRSVPDSLKSLVPRMTGGTFPESFSVDENGDPDDEIVDEIAMVAVDDAERWLRDAFPAAMQAIPYARVSVQDADGMRQISLSTGGWSGCESVIWAVLEHSVMRRCLRTEMRGGHYVFVVPLEDDPAHNLADAIAARAELIRAWGHLYDVEPDRADVPGWDGSNWDSTTCADCDGPAGEPEDVELRVADVDARGSRDWRREVRAGDVPEVVPVCASCREQVRP